MVVRKASKIFQWEKVGEYFQLLALRNLQAGMSLDWDIGVRTCPPAQHKRTLNLSDTFGEALTNIRKGTIHYLTPNVYEAQWDMDTSPLIEVLMNPRNNNDKDCSAFKNQSKKMKIYFETLAPNTTLTVLGNNLLRKYLRQNIQSLADRNIKIFLSVQHSPHLLEPPVPLCYPYTFGKNPVDTSLKIFYMAYPDSTDLEMSALFESLQQSYIMEKQGQDGVEGVGKTLFRRCIQR